MEASPQCQQDRSGRLMVIEKDVLIREDQSIKEALKKLSRGGKKVLMVVDEGMKLLGTITDGDIRRALLKNKDLESPVSDIFNPDPICIFEEDASAEQIKKVLLENLIELLPVVDSSHRIVKYITWDEVLSGERIPREPLKSDVPVVIMAGGKGTRLDPFTRILPKPLIPVGDKPSVEIIIDEFKQQGIYQFILSLNHKAELVESYFNSMEKDYTVQYVREDECMGTAGSLKLMEHKLPDIFVVSNCDVVVRANFAEVIDFHQEKAASMTILSSIQHYRIPYGVITFKEEGEVVNVLEKPEYTFTINTGVYVLNREAIGLIPRKSSFDMTDLMKVLLQRNKKVLMYPVNENDYVDMGQWDEYKKALDKIKFLDKR